MAATAGVFMNHCIESIAGTYALILRVENPVHLEVGRLGKLQLVPGFYLYCGSARGPGGVKARVDRHLRKRKKHRWHIDYVSSQVPIVDVWYSYAEFWHECHWAETAVAWADNQIPYAGFGSSDCHCDAHLIYYHDQPQVSEFKRRMSQEGVAQSLVEAIVSWRSPLPRSCRYRNPDIIAAS